MAGRRASPSHCLSKRGGEGTHLCYEKETSQKPERTAAVGSLHADPIKAAGGAVVSRGCGSRPSMSDTWETSQDGAAGVSGCGFFLVSRV